MRRLCLFVCWLVRSLWFLDKYNSHFMTFGADIQQHTLLTFERSRSKFKVKSALLKIFKSLNNWAVLWDIFTIFGCAAHLWLQEPLKWFWHEITFDNIQDGRLAEVALSEWFLVSSVRHFSPFSGEYHVKFGHFDNFSCIIFRQKCLVAKVDWAAIGLRLCFYRTWY